MDWPPRKNLQCHERWRYKEIMQPVVDTNTQLYMCYMYYIVRVLYSSFHALVWHCVGIYTVGMYICISQVLVYSSTCVPIKSIRPPEHNSLEANTLLYTMLCQVVHDSEIG